MLISYVPASGKVETIIENREADEMAWGYPQLQRPMRCVTSCKYQINCPREVDQLGLIYVPLTMKF